MVLGKPARDARGDRRWRGVGRAGQPRVNAAPKIAAACPWPPRAPVASTARRDGLRARGLRWLRCGCATLTSPCTRLASCNGIHPAALASPPCRALEREWRSDCRWMQGSRLAASLFATLCNIRRARHRPMRPLQQRSSDARRAVCVCVHLSPTASPGPPAHCCRDGAHAMASYAAGAATSRPPASPGATAPAAAVSWPAAGSSSVAGS